MTLSALRLSLISAHGAKSPGAVLVEGNVYVEGMDFVATYVNNEQAEAALVEAGWIPDTQSCIAFWPEPRMLAVKPPRANASSRRSRVHDRRWKTPRRVDLWTL